MPLIVVFTDGVIFSGGFNSEVWREVAFIFIHLKVNVSNTFLYSINL
jgi:hypothetical protein